jgi:hypothetical protein
MDPGIDHEHHWLRILQPLEYGKPSSIRAAWGEGSPERPVFQLDNVRCWAWKYGDTWNYEWTDSDVSAPSGPDGREKSPERSGPFKRAFDNFFVFVVGTAGSDEEDAALMARARFDAASWWYRANGDVEILTDEDITGDNGRWGQNVILYGNSNTNSAWDEFLPKSCPVNVRRGSITVGDDTCKGDDLGCVFVYPRKDSCKNLVGVFRDTGVKGAKAGYGLLPFTSGVGYPDYAVFGADFLGGGDAGVRAAGWFDHRWDLQAGGYRTEPAESGGR